MLAFFYRSSSFHKLFQYNLVRIDSSMSSIQQVYSWNKQNEPVRWRIILLFVLHSTVFT